MRMRRYLTALGLAVVSATACSTALGADQPPFSAEQLGYPGAAIETRIEVSGAGAAQLVGGGLDAHLAELQVRAKAAQEAGASEEELAEIAESISLVESTKELARSFLGFTLVVMKPSAPVEAADFVKHYQDLTSSRGWSPLALIQDEEDGNAVLLMLAPGGKGIFLAVNDKEEIVSAMVTTSKPLGELIAKIFRNGEESNPLDLLVGAVTQTLGRPQHKATPPAEEQAPATQEEKE